MDNLQFLCRFQGGSHAYGLNTPESDVDLRGVFVNTDVRNLIGLGKHEHQVKQDATEDSSYKELRHFLRLLSGGNSEAVEMLFNRSWQEKTKEWELIQLKRNELISPVKLFYSLSGYIKGELRLANGERTGKLGGKRKSAIDKYGFSPKNFVQLLRLSWAGAYFFQHHVFPVKVSGYNPHFHDLLMCIKTQPEQFNKKQLNDLAQVYEKDFIKSYESCDLSFSTFNDSLADQLCLQIYGPKITRLLLDCYDS